MYSKGREMDSISWWEKVQSHITEGVDSGRGGEVWLFVQSVYPNN